MSVIAGIERGQKIRCHSASEIHRKLRVSSRRPSPPFASGVCIPQSASQRPKTLNNGMAPTEYLFEDRLNMLGGRQIKILRDSSVERRQIGRTLDCVSQFLKDVPANGFKKRASNRDRALGVS